MKICSVVVTYNRKRLLEECLSSLLSQTYNLNKIIVIDNNSDDGTEEYLKDRGILDLPQILYIKLQENIGGAGGFYSGIKEALNYKFDWIWIMDDDTIPTKNALEKLLDARNSIEGKISFLCSKVIGVENEEMNIPNISKRSGENGYPLWMKYLTNSIVEVNSATFVSVLINFNAIIEIGLPWKEFFIWGDDIEYTSRLSKFYAPGYAVGKSVVIHKRLGGKNITIVEEENINRINFYIYKYRNDLLIANEYERKRNVIAIIIRGLKDIIKIIKYSRVLKVKKISIIIKSIYSGLFNINIKTKFKNRMKIN